jgi:hypothetical protein
MLSLLAGGGGYMLAINSLKGGGVEWNLLLGQYQIINKMTLYFSNILSMLAVLL